MPAVSLARLKQQTEPLVWQFTRPADFLIKLRDLFEFYADRVYRAGQAVPPSSWAPAYHIPPLVIRHLEVELRTPCRQNPAAALNLIDFLTGQAMFEFRLLASILLGHVPLNEPDLVIDRLYNLARPGEGSAALKSLFANGGRTVRKELPDQWIELIERWIGASSEELQAVGLLAITVTANDEEFDNLPTIYRIFSEIFQRGPNTLQAELQEALQALLRRAPQETVFLLRQVLPLSTSPTTHRLVRQAMPRLPVEYQIHLRQALQSYKAN
jgi:hypothetical protein